MYLLYAASPFAELQTQRQFVAEELAGFVAAVVFDFAQVFELGFGLTEGEEAVADFVALGLGQVEDGVAAQAGAAEEAEGEGLGLFLDRGVEEEAEGGAGGGGGQDEVGGAVGEAAGDQAAEGPEFAVVELRAAAGEGGGVAGLGGHRHEFERAEAADQFAALLFRGLGVRFPGRAFVETADEGVLHLFLLSALEAAGAAAPEGPPFTGGLGVFGEAGAGVPAGPETAQTQFVAGVAEAGAQAPAEEVETASFAAGVEGKMGQQFEQGVGELAEQRQRPFAARQAEGGFELFHQALATGGAAFGAEGGLECGNGGVDGVLRHRGALLGRDGGAALVDGAQVEGEFPAVAAAGGFEPEVEGADFVGGGAEADLDFAFLGLAEGNDGAQGRQQAEFVGAADAGAEGVAEAGFGGGEEEADRLVGADAEGELGRAGDAFSGVARQDAGEVAAAAGFEGDEVGAGDASLDARADAVAGEAVGGGAEGDGEIEVAGRQFRHRLAGPGGEGLAEALTQELGGEATAVEEDAIGEQGAAILGRVGAAQEGEELAGDGSFAFVGQAEVAQALAAGRAGGVDREKGEEAVEDQLLHFVAAETGAERTADERRAFALDHQIDLVGSVIGEEFLLGRAGPGAELGELATAELAAEAFLGELGEGEVDVVAAEEEVRADGAAAQDAGLGVFDEGEVAGAAADVDDQGALAGEQLRLPIGGAGEPGAEGGERFLKQHRMRQAGFAGGFDGELTGDFVEGGGNGEQHLLIGELAGRAVGVFHPGESRIPGGADVAEVEGRGVDRRQLVGVFQFFAPGEDFGAAVDAVVGEPGFGRADQSFRQGGAVFAGPEAADHRLGAPREGTAVAFGEWRQEGEAGQAVALVDFPAGGGLRQRQNMDATRFRAEEISVGDGRVGGAEIDADDITHEKLSWVVPPQLSTSVAE